MPWTLSCPCAVGLGLIISRLSCVGPAVTRRPAAPSHPASLHPSCASQGAGAVLPGSLCSVCVPGPIQPPGPPRQGDKGCMGEGEGPGGREGDGKGLEPLGRPWSSVSSQWGPPAWARAPWREAGARLAWGSWRQLPSQVTLLLRARQAEVGDMGHRVLGMALAGARGWGPSSKTKLREDGTEAWVCGCGLVPDSSLTLTPARKVEEQGPSQARCPVSISSLCPVGGLPTGCVSVAARA